MIRRLWHWFYGCQPIRRKLYISFCVLACTPILVLGIFTFRQSRVNLENQTRITMRNNLSQLANKTDFMFQQESTIIKYLAYNLDFRETLEHQPIDRVELALQLNESVEPILWYFIASDHNIKSIDIYVPGMSSTLGSFVKPDTQIADSPWYQQHEYTNSNIWTYEDGIIFGSRSILDASTVSKKVAVIRLNLFPSVITDSIDSLTYLDNGILLLSDDGNVVYERLPQNVEVDLQSLALSMSDPDSGTTETDGYILMSETIPTSDWKLYYYIDKSMITNELKPIISSTMLMAGICLLVSLIVISLLSRALSRRIFILKDQAEQVAAGDFTHVTRTDDTDEIGIVINSFHEMALRLNETINTVYKLKLEKSATELKALQAMINPHFLYNILSSITWKAIRQGNKEIQETTVNLAKFYRTSLNNGELLTSVESEMENVRSYLSLQQGLHDVPIVVSYNIDEAALPCHMLNFLLQPIVENAVKHGIDYIETNEKRQIRIGCALQQDFLIFTVANNGPLMDEETLHHILTHPGKGYGICNIQQRIELYYGSECGVFPSVTDDGFTLFTVKIRKEMNNDL